MNIMEVMMCSDNDQRSGDPKKPVILEEITGKGLYYIAFLIVYNYKNETNYTNKLKTK